MHSIHKINCNALPSGYTSAVSGVAKLILILKSDDDKTPYLTRTLCNTDLPLRM